MADCRVDEVADGIYRISTYLPDVVASHGLTINQFLVLADEPLLFHTGLRTTFPETVSAVARLVPVERLRWLSFGHVEADECGAMNHYLAAAPQLEVAFGALGCRVSLEDMADRPPRSLAPGEAIDLGGRRVEYDDVAVDDSRLSGFQRELLRAIRAVAWGDLVSYGELAAVAGRPRAARAAGSFCAGNRLALVVPCHRVVAAADRRQQGP